MDEGKEAIVHSIVPNGDIMLVVGTEPHRLLVLSTVLKNSSKVFAALLGPNFLEGQASSSPLPKMITLPDDDATAMFDMCDLLHNKQVKDLIVRPTADRILAFAVVVDKYDCVDALQIQIQGVLLGYPAVREDLEFTDCSHSSSTQPLTSLLEAEWAKLFPSNLVSALEHKRSTVQRSIIFDLPVAGLEGRDCPCGEYDGCENTAESLRGHFGIKFWPPDFGYRTLLTATRIIMHLENVRSSRNCGHGIITVESTVYKNFVQDLKEDCMMLCLSCIKTGKAEFKDQCEDQVHLAEYKVMAGV